MRLNTPKQPGPLTSYVLSLGHALGASSDEDALDRVAHVAGVPPNALTHAVASGTLGTLPTRSVRAILTAAKLVPGVSSKLQIDDLAPFDPAPLQLLVNAVCRLPA
jgi:hypothetical protein